MSIFFDIRDLILFHKIVYERAPISLPTFIKPYTGFGRLRNANLDSLSFISDAFSNVPNSSSRSPFYKSFFTKSYIHGTDCHFTYVVFRTNLSLNTKSPIFYGTNYLIVLELAFLHFNFKTHIYINAHVLKYAYHVKFYISYRVRGLYRLGITCYLHSLLCNNSIICILCKMILFQFLLGKKITQPTLTPPQTRDYRCAIVCAEIVSRGRHVTKQLWEY